MDLVSFKDAKATGLKFYFTGKPCKRGHLSVRRVKGCGCVQCQQESLKNWREKNPEKNREIERVWREKNRKRRNEQARIIYAANPEKVTEKTKKFYARHAEKLRKKRREYHYKASQDPQFRRAAAERTKQWAKNNPDRVKTNARNGKQKRKNVPGKHTAQDIAAIIKLQKGKCAYCKVKLGKKRHIDHIVPVSKGGTNDRQNLQITCIPCNLTKGARDPIFHAQTLGMLL